MSKTDHNQCFVCDAISVGINFGVPTCMPCKAFFRRNASKIDVRLFRLVEHSIYFILFKDSEIQM